MKGINEIPFGLRLYLNFPRHQAALYKNITYINILVQGICKKTGSNNLIWNGKRVVCSNLNRRKQGLCQPWKPNKLMQEQNYPDLVFKRIPDLLFSQFGFGWGENSRLFAQSILVHVSFWDSPLGAGG
jgi:hypothetical protein